MKKYLFFFLIIGLMFQACNKDKVLTDEIKPSPKSEVNSRSNDRFEKTVIGKKIDNPFLLEKMQEAENNVYVGAAKTLQATDFYVEFHPRNVEDIIKLDNRDIDYFDFPLGYEIKVMGDIYQDLEGENMPTLYAVISANAIIPDVPHTVISSLYLDESDEAIVAESFRLTKHFSELNNMDIKNISFPSNTNTPLGAIPLCPDGETPVLVGPGQWECISCSPGYHLEFTGDPYDYDCVKDTPSNGSGCVSCVKGHKRKPGGRVLVEDTELSSHGNLCTYEPVRRVKVTVLSRFFWPTSTWTDDNGCWKIDAKRWGHVWTRVKFTNNRCSIRATHKKNFNSIWKWVITHNSRFEKHGGPKFNDIDIVFNMWINQGSYSHLNWGAATVNNAVHEFHDYAEADGIAPPPNGLVIRVGQRQRYGYAFMPHYMGPMLSSYAFGNGLEGNHFAISPFGTLLALMPPVAIANQLFPDVFIGIRIPKSDVQKSLAYHELAHASHFQLVGKFYWAELVAAEIANSEDGHGNEFSNDAERIALVESWAEYLGGHQYVHRTYGPINSIPFNWQIRLERTWNERTNHIPIGLFNDLQDIGEPLFDPDPEYPVTPPEDYISAWQQNDHSARTIITDNVSGFTNAQMFSSLKSATTIVGYRNTLISTHLSSTSNSASQVIALFNSY